MAPAALVNIQPTVDTGASLTDDPDIRAALDQPVTARVQRIAVEPPAPPAPLDWSAFHASLKGVHR
jgi:hypothetical protein